METCSGAGIDHIPAITGSWLLGLQRAWGNDLKKRKYSKRQRKSVVSEQLIGLVKWQKIHFPCPGLASPRTSLANLCAGSLLSLLPAAKEKERVMFRGLLKGRLMIGASVLSEAMDLMPEVLTRVPILLLTIM